MTVSRVRRLVWMVWSLTLLLLVTAVWFAYLGRGESSAIRATLPHALLGFGLMLILTTCVVTLSRDPGNRLVWLLLVQVSVLSVAERLFRTYSFAAAEHSWPGPNTSQWLSYATLPALFVVFGIILLLFPNGRLLSPRWRPFVGFGTLLILVATTGTLAAVDGTVGPAGFASARMLYSNNTVIGNVGMVLVVAYVLICALSLLIRLRRSDAVERLQIKWVVLAGVFAFAIHPLLLFPSGGYQEFIPGVQAISLGVAFTFAILRYRLWDVDLVIKRALVYGSLAVVIGGLYVVVVVGVGTLLGDAVGSTALSIAAIALVAVVFEPIRERLQRVANRLVYGERATPYEVMASFTHQMTGVLSIEELLPHTAETVAAGVGAETVRVSLFLPDGGRRIETWPPGAPGGQPEHSYAVAYGDQEVGEIGITKAAGEPLRPAEQRLLSSLASEAGVAFTNTRLAIELEDRFDELTVQAAELEASRARIVTAADTERRRLESEIRTEVGEPLAALRLDVVAAGQAVDADRIADLIAKSNTILDSLREIARGVYPPILADEGLTRAIESLASRLDSAPEIDIDGVVGARFSSEVEAAVYYSVAQALRILDRDGASAGVSVIKVTADDAGISFDTPAGLPTGTTELIGDRVAALGGTVVKDERLRGFIPASATAPIG